MCVLGVWYGIYEYKSWYPTSNEDASMLFLKNNNDEESNSEFGKYQNVVLTILGNSAFSF